jgi:hypothetical protein
MSFGLVLGAEYFRATWDWSGAAEIRAMVGNAHQEAPGLWITELIAERHLSETTQGRISSILSTATKRFWRSFHFLRIREYDSGNPCFAATVAGRYRDCAEPRLT